jgi:hypothetical protein
MYYLLIYLLIYLKFVKFVKIFVLSLKTLNERDKYYWDSFYLIFISYDFGPNLLNKNKLNMRGQKTN